MTEIKSLITSGGFLLFDHSMHQSLELKLFVLQLCAALVVSPTYPGPFNLSDFLPAHVGAPPPRQVSPMHSYEHVSSASAVHVVKKKTSYLRFVG